MTHIERGQRVAYITSCIEVHGILPEAEVQVEVGIDAELSECLVHDAHFTVYVVMQRFALPFGQFAANEYLLFVEIGSRQCVHQLIAAEFMRYIGCQSGFGILVETFEQCDAEYVLYTESRSRVPAGYFVEVSVGVLPFRLLGGREFMTRPFHFHGMYEAGDGNELFGYNGIFG